jgi:hypothetical protein
LLGHINNKKNIEKTEPKMDSSIDAITNNIQLALAPVFLLTAVATLINAISTRLARTVDRMRAIQQLIYQGEV